jgi:hypothetical protein
LRFTTHDISDGVGFEPGFDRCRSGCEAEAIETHLNSRREDIAPRLLSVHVRDYPRIGGRNAAG